METKAALNTTISAQITTQSCTIYMRFIHQRHSKENNEFGKYTFVNAACFLIQPKSRSFRKISVKTTVNLIDKTLIQMIIIV